MLACRHQYMICPFMCPFYLINVIELEWELPAEEGMLKALNILWNQPT